MSRFHGAGETSLPRILAIAAGSTVAFIAVVATAAHIEETRGRDEPEPDEVLADEDTSTGLPSSIDARLTGTSTPRKSAATSTDKLTARTKLSENFTYGEFWQKVRRECGFRRTVPYPPEFIKDRLMPLIGVLERLRTELDGATIKINSAYRSPKYNKCIGGRSKSQHVEGRAVDIVVPGKSPKQVATAIKQLHDRGDITIGGLGVYRNFVHVDIRPRANRTYAQWRG